MERQLASLDLTHVIYDTDSYLSFVLALLTLTPILLMASYTSLAVFTRELSVLIMWAGQLLCEASNGLLKDLLKQPRPNAELGDGYGFPSSHSQYMAYFATFLIFHISFRHRFAANALVDLSLRLLVVLGLVAWAGGVAYSRYALGYHTAPQVLWGIGIGIAFGTVFYTLAELIPTRCPKSILGRIRTWILTNDVSTWFRIRDGWLVWDDAGHEVEWWEWRRALDGQSRTKSE
ncbi:PAP2 superfamily-domain-containing protein [Thelephora terrestris]|uniref:PAP2 superfamily-domain-containing protein n=1 Tax=Thelephora terrestris TaxID=56493 RepID=A0A9P6L1K4_9AGAM|nr:PAP2 superfamily-domain-containing protein [Thelephora terrestris]